MDREQQQHLQDLLQIHRNRLRPLEKRAALLGTSTPPEILIEIGNIQDEINKIEMTLRDFTPIVRIDDSLQDKPIATSSAASFLSQNYVFNSKEFKLSYRSAKELCVAGIGQARMIIAYSGQIKRILQMGGQIRFILINPEGPAMQMAAQRSSTSHDMQLIKQEHWSALDRLVSPAKDVDNSGKLEIKLVDLLLPFTIYGFDIHDQERAKIFVWITNFRESSEMRPGFVVSAVHDPEWFGFFRDQFEKLWNWDRAKAWDMDRVFF